MNQKLLEMFAQATTLLAGILVLCAVGFYIVRKYRDRASKDISEPYDMMSKFRELHAEGGLSDEEFRTIKQKLARQVQAELRDDARSG